MHRTIPEIDYSRCTGCGACSELFPQFFVLREGKAWLINHEHFDPERDKAIAFVCPFKAIRINGISADDAGGGGRGRRRPRG